MIRVYNKQGLDDTLLCLFHQGRENQQQAFETKNDLTIIRQNGKIIGVNIRGASKKFANLPHGLDMSNDLDQTVIDYLAKETNLSTDTATLQQQFVIGHVLEKSMHPNSDHLSICRVDVGTEVLQIVCGAANVEAGQKVVVAKIGSMMPNGLIIAEATLRNVDSQGMICSAKELNLPQKFQTTGIMILAASAPVGDDFMRYFKKEMMGK